MVSICIPTYRQPELLSICLDSILRQDHAGIEVIISDDSPDDCIREVFTRYEDKLKIRYFKNKVPAGSPANWNLALSHAEGDMVLLMHQDDHFRGPASLSGLVKPLEEDDRIDWSFGKNHGRTSTGEYVDLLTKPSWISRLSKEPYLLMMNNVIGPPSNVLIRRRSLLEYDASLVWLVDIEYYIRLITSGYRPCYVDAPLTTIGLHDAQITAHYQRNPGEGLKEHQVLLRRYGLSIFRDLTYFDFYWRAIRNTLVREGKLPETVQADQELGFIGDRQRRIGPSRLMNGALSKTLMLKTWLQFRKTHAHARD